jgi:hypothetical protein
MQGEHEITAAPLAAEVITGVAGAEIAHTSLFVDSPRALYSVANTQPVCGRRHTRVSHDTVPTPRRVQDGLPEKRADPGRTTTPRRRNAKWPTLDRPIGTPSRAAIGRPTAGDA